MVSSERAALASRYREQGKHEQAEPLYLHALHIRRDLWPRHTEVAYPLTGLATTYSEQGRYAQAEPLYQRAL